MKGMRKAWRWFLRAWRLKLSEIDFPFFFSSLCFFFFFFFFFFFPLLFFFFFFVFFFFAKGDRKKIWLNLNFKGKGILLKLSEARRHHRDFLFFCFDFCFDSKKKGVVLYLVHQSGSKLPWPINLT